MNKATAQFNYKEVTEVKRVEVKTATHVRLVTLTLTETEAQTLRTLCAYVGGDPKATQRGNMDAIKDALTNLGFVPEEEVVSDRRNVLGVQYESSVVFVK